MQPSLDVVRISGRGVERHLGERGINGDSAARSAVDTVRAFDRFLAAADAPAAARIPDGFRVALVAGLDNADGSREGINLGGSRQVFTRHTARMPETIGHELVHSVDGLVRNQTGPATSEGWADVVGNHFARSVGAPGSADWKVGDGMFRKAIMPAGFLRDIGHPRVGSVPELREYFKLLGTGQFDVHETSGVLTHAATIAAERTSPEMVGRVFTQALLHDLGPRTRASVPAVHARGMRQMQATGEFPTERLYLAELRASARATLDAAARLHGAASPEFAAIRDAWSAVGLSVTWSPRASER